MKTYQICGNCKNLVKGELMNKPFIACSGNVNNPSKCCLAKKFYQLKIEDREFLCPRESFIMFATLKALKHGIKDPNYTVETATEYLESLGYTIDVTD